ncbi:hypothetical protein [Vaginisenegalia massiliensis]|uniref:hypothetical protein n=1 Tax=Vaginisenegalia massiliensis TaxID=2058294 RepID=UPI000F53B53B|nr:hypothetical protein [Vaginisenegalia massiliensis]
MLKEFDHQQIDRRFEEFKTSDLGKQLDQLQRMAQANQIPVLILIDGWESAGKGQVIKDLTRELDPRYVRVEVFEDENQVEQAHPLTWRYWQALPSKEEIAVYDRSFYYDLFNSTTRKKKQLTQGLIEIKALEEPLVQDQMLVFKFFLYVSQKAQRERIEALEEDDYRDYLLTDADYEQNEDYQASLKWFDKVLEASHTDLAPWHIVSAEDLKLASKTVLGLVIEELTAGIERIKKGRQEIQVPARQHEASESPLAKLDLSQSMAQADYDQVIEDLQTKAARLVYEAYTKGIAIHLVFEGMDAAGKGGAVKRLTREIDPRSYRIYGIKAPSEEELAHHYLWRFQTKFPQDGGMVIFDRSWYGRVLVERVEGFASPQEWERAYEEINQMEAVLTQHGSVVMKFFLAIDEETQAQRFNDREQEPDKNYKITPEDWRNRAKWGDYNLAFDEMLVRTNTKAAPWYLIPANDKLYARVQVLEHFITHLEDHLGKKKSKKNKKDKKNK